MKREQRNLLHSVIAHGLVALRSQKLILEGKIINFEKHLMLSNAHDREILRDISLAALKSELEEINEKLVIGSNAMLELETVRGMSAPMMGDASELQNGLPGIFGQQLTQMFVEEEESRRHNTPHVVVARTVRAVGTFEVGETFMYRGDAVMVFKKGGEYRYIQSGKVVPEPLDPDRPLVDVLVQPMMLWVEE